MIVLVFFWKKFSDEYITLLFLRFHMSVSMVGEVSAEEEIDPHAIDTNTFDNIDTMSNNDINDIDMENFGNNIEGG